MSEQDEPAPAGERTPGIFCNLIQVRIYDDYDVVRLVFQDAIIGKKGSDRAHIICSKANARALAHEILRLFKG